MSGAGETPEQPEKKEPVMTFQHVWINGNLFLIPIWEDPDAPPMDGWDLLAVLFWVCVIVAGAVGFAWWLR